MDRWTVDRPNLSVVGSVCWKHSPIIQSLKLFCSSHSPSHALQHSSLVITPTPNTLHKPQQHTLNTLIDPSNREREMPMGSISGSLSSPRVDVFVDMGHPFLNRTVDGFLRIGTVGLAKAAADEAYHFSSHGSVSHSWLKDMCKEGAHWGSVAGVYAGMEYGVAKIRGRYDWKNAMIGGALTGAVIAAVTSNGKKDKIVKDAITGGAIATASVFLNHIAY